MDKIQERYKDKKIICVHQDWRIEDTKYIKIPTIRMLGGKTKWLWNKIEWIILWVCPNLFMNKIIKFKDKKLFLCGNRFRRFHRDELINFLRENNLEKKGLISILWEGKTLEDSCPNLELSDNPIDPFTIMCFVRFQRNLWAKDWLVEVLVITNQKKFGNHLYKVIPMIISWQYRLGLKLNLDLFDDIIDTSFYQEDNLNNIFKIIKNNLIVIENECVEDKRFKDSIWERLNKNYQKVMDYGNIKNYIKDF